MRGSSLAHGQPNDISSIAVDELLFLVVDVQHVDFILTFYLEGFCLFDDFTFVFDILLLFLMGFALEIKDEFFIGLGVDVRELVEDFLLDGFFTGGGL